MVHFDLLDITWWFTFASWPVSLIVSRTHLAPPHQAALSPDGDGVGAGGHRPRGFPAAAGKVVLHRTGPLPATENSGLATAWLLFWLAARREVRGAHVRCIKPDADVAAPQPAHEVLARCR